VNGEAAVLDPQTNKIGFIDKTGKMVVPPVLDEANADRTPFGGQPLCYNNGLCPVILGHRMIQNNHSPQYYYAYADRQGKMKLVMPDSIIFTGPFSEGLAPVVSSGGKLGFIDTTGAVAIPFRYELAVAGGYPFPEIVIPKFDHGFAYLKAFKGYIDSAGNEYFSGRQEKDHYNFSH